MQQNESEAWVHESFPVGPLQCNCTLIGDKVSGNALIIDPGGDPEFIFDRLKTLGLERITGIIHTHAHLDHFLASAEMKRRTGAPLALHRDDQFLWDSLEQQCAMVGVPYVPTPDPDHWIDDDVDLQCCGGVSIHTPGHTPGSMCFWFAPANLLVAGDTLFFRSVGRTDLNGGDWRALTRSIQHRLFTLDETALVIPGHGPTTTLGAEMRDNPFVGHNAA
ncbi:MAG: MBL fold metallo-hydrolase [Gammaproteobacteria bacterium AqS3]|nr:MBL fold metallo-hydrolase [Gammaproteobacteria bacterium AqS3]